MTYLEEYKSRMDEALQIHARSYLPENPLSQATRYAILNGGKRTRSAIVLMVADALGQSFNPMQAAIGIEVFHCASLVADDLPCMDDDDMRREKPSTHKAFGEGLALLASYALIADGYGCIARCCAANPELSPRVCQIALDCAAHNTGLQGATGGQFLDLCPPNLKEETIRDIHHKKTTSLFEIAFVYGWLFGGGSIEKVSEIKSLAASFGMAFQIADDIGDQEQDAEHPERVNYAARLGEEKALSALQVELSLYEDKLKALELNTPALRSLADLLAKRQPTQPLA